MFMTKRCIGTMVFILFAAAPMVWASELEVVEEKPAQEVGVQQQDFQTKEAVQQATPEQATDVTPAAAEAQVSASVKPTETEKPSAAASRRSPSLFGLMSRGLSRPRIPRPCRLLRLWPRPKRMSLRVTP